AEDGIRDRNVTGVQTCALPISFSFNFELLFILVSVFLAVDDCFLSISGFSVSNAFISSSFFIVSGVFSCLSFCISCSFTSEWSGCSLFSIIVSAFDSNCCDVISVPSSTDFVSFESLLFSVLLSISAWMGCCTVSLLLSFSNILLKFESLLVFSLSTLGGISFTSCCSFCKVSAWASSLC